MTTAGAELDREVALSLFGQWREPIPEFSTRDLAADYLIRFLKRSRVQSLIDVQGGRWRCQLSRNRGLISVGAGDTRPLAICRAVLSAGFRAERSQPPVSSQRAERPRSSERDRSPHRCAACETPLAVSKGPAERPRFCNLCAWERGREKVLEESRTHRARR